jgi:hypothetical protein
VSLSAVRLEFAENASVRASLERVNARIVRAFVSIGQWGKFSHFQPPQSDAASAATGMEARTSQFRSRMWILLEDEGLRGDAF